MEIHQPIATMMLTQPEGYAGTGGVLFTADLNGDNRQDLIREGGGLTVLIGKGEGPFTKRLSFRFFNRPEVLSFEVSIANARRLLALAMSDRGLAFVVL